MYSVIKIIDNNKLVQFNVSPNPASDNIIVAVLSKTKTESAMYELVNAIGQTVQSGQLNRESDEYRQKINLQDMPRGIYYLKIMLDQNVHIRLVSLK
jgi:Secretion system C-terminal sorting domain